MDIEQRPYHRNSSCARHKLKYACPNSCCLHNNLSFCKKSSSLHRYSLSVNFKGQFSVFISWCLINKVQRIFLYQGWNGWVTIRSRNWKLLYLVVRFLALSDLQTSKLPKRYGLCWFLLLQSFTFSDLKIQILFSFLFITKK